MLPSTERHADTRTAETERPDPSYWTAYDRYMIECEARELRRAHMWSLLVRGYNALRARIAGTRRDDGHRSVRELSPRT